MAMIYMMLLALQFAMQPVFSAKYSPQGVDKTLIVLLTEALKCILAFLMLYVSFPTDKAFGDVLRTWTVKDWMKSSGLPAIMYAVQNVFALLAYEHLTGVEFNVINQTKTVSAALFCYILLGRPQSAVQISALLMVGLGAVCIEGTVDVASYFDKAISGDWDGILGGEGLSFDRERTVKGVLPCLAASGISGLAGAITQKILQGEKGGKNSYLYSCQLSFFSFLYLTASYLYNHSVDDFTSDVGKIISARSYYPILNQAMGGILVGLVTKYAGSVRKGFALIGGILITAMLQSYAYDKPLTRNQEIGGILAVTSMYAHANFPVGWREIYKKTKKKKKQAEINVGGKKLFETGGGKKKMKEQ